MKTFVLILLGMLACIRSAAAADRPNLTGKWTHTGTDSSSVYTIDHQEPILTFSYSSEFHGGPLSGGMSGSETYTIDGKEIYRKADDSREYWISAGWQGDSLVILRVAKNGYKVTVTREAWTLGPDDQTLTRAVRTITMDGVSESSTVFLKQ